ncbi:MAG: cytochrome c biogenesis protein CcdA [Actinomycetota bacterium]
MSFWFVAGMLAAVNPCGFVLLPTYLMYFLGLSSGEGAQPVKQRDALRRALKVSAALSGGFMVVFVIAAGLANYFTNWLTANAKFATAFFGVALLALGVAMLFGYKLPFTTPSVGQGQKDQTVRSMFVYGLAYATASLGCTIGFFITAVFTTSQNSGPWDGITNGIAYAAGMALIVGGLTVTLAFANNGLLKLLRRGLQYMDRIAAAFVLISGLYLLWYFYWVDLREEGDAITDWVTRLQGDINNLISNNQWFVTVVLFSLFLGTISYVYQRRWDVLGVTTAVGLGGGLILSRATTGVLIIAGVFAAAGALGVLAEQRGESDGDLDDPGEPDDSPADEAPLATT